MRTGGKESIIRQIQKISGKYSEYEVFTDWIRCMALSISNSCSFIHDSLWETREGYYRDTIKKYTPEEQSAFAEMMAWLAESLEDSMEDALGSIYMEAGMGSKASGQFFTPFHLSELCARITLPDLEDEYSKLGTISLNEPSSGGGGMIIAAAKVLKDAGIDYQRALDVIAQDLDWKGVYMTYVQLSLLGIKAICVQGDTLAEPYDRQKTERSRLLFTPRKMGMLI